MLKGELSDSSDGANQYAFDLSEDGDNDIPETKKAAKMTKEEQDKDAQQKLSNYQIIRLLGTGAYAQVKLAQNKQTK